MASGGWGKEGRREGQRCWSGWSRGHGTVEVTRSAALLPTAGPTTMLCSMDHVVVLMVDKEKSEPVYFCCGNCPVVP